MVIFGVGFSTPQELPRWLLICYLLPNAKNATSNGAGIRKLHDGDGLYMRVYLDGRKYWRMRYWQTGKEKSLSVGVYPKVSLSYTRRKREELCKQLQANLDPSAECRAETLRKKFAAENSF